MSEAKKTLLILSLAVIVGLFLFFFGEPRMPGEPVAAAPTAQTPTHPTPTPGPAPALDAGVIAAPAEPEPEPAPVAEPPDIFAGDAPDVITRNHMRLIDGQTISYHETKALYDYGVDHQDDARPQLLLAWDAMQRNWDGMATRLYVKAYKADPRIKELPRVTHDLLSVAMRFDKMEGREASAAIEEILGKDALPVLDEKLQEARDRGRTRWVARLETLREKLAE